MRHPNQRTGYGNRPNYVGPARSPYETSATGKYLVEKLMEEGTPTERWVCMSFGDIDHGARPGEEFDLLIRRAETLEGTVRIVRQKGRVLVWETPPASAPAQEASCG